MPLPRIRRGEIWLVDLGYLGKVRPVAVVSFRLAQDGELAGKEESAEFFVADVWVRADGAWKVAARYAAAPDRHRPLGAPPADVTIPKKY